jgi:hypothetical protein
LRSGGSREVRWVNESLVSRSPEEGEAINGSVTDAGAGGRVGRDREAQVLRSQGARTREHPESRGLGRCIVQWEHHHSQAPPGGVEAPYVCPEPCVKRITEVLEEAALAPETRFLPVRMVHRVGERIGHAAPTEGNPSSPFSEGLTC